MKFFTGLFLVTIGVLALSGCAKHYQNGDPIEQVVLFNNAGTYAICDLAAADIAKPLSDLQPDMPRKTPYSIIYFGYVMSNGNRFPLRLAQVKRGEVVYHLIIDARRYVLEEPYSVHFKKALDEGWKEVSEEVFLEHNPGALPATKKAPKNAAKTIPAKPAKK